MLKPGGPEDFDPKAQKYEGLMGLHLSLQIQYPTPKHRAPRGLLWVSETLSPWTEGDGDGWMGIFPSNLLGVDTEKRLRVSSFSD